MNLTDQALHLFRRLQAHYLGIRGSSTHEAETLRLAKLKYRAYLRWKRRDAKVAGTEPVGSIASRQNWFQDA